MERPRQRLYDTVRLLYDTKAPLQRIYYIPLLHTPHLISGSASEHPTSRPMMDDMHGRVSCSINALTTAYWQAVKKPHILTRCREVDTVIINFPAPNWHRQQWRCLHFLTVPFPFNLLRTAGAPRRGETKDLKSKAMPIPKSKLPRSNIRQQRL